MSNGNFVQPIEILLVEDNPADVRLTTEALKEEKIYNNLSCCHRRRRSHSLSSQRRQVCESCETGPYLIGPQPAEKRRPRST